MPKLICPKCMKSVDVADDFTGREVTCPACAATFEVPAKYTPAVLTPPQPAAEPARTSPPVPADPPKPPPGLVPPTPPSLPANLPAAYARSCGCSLNPRVVVWMPAVLLTITLLCTLLPWVGSYLGGYPVYSQGPWRAMLGYVDRNFALEGKAQLPIGWLDHVRSDWELLVPALLLLICAFCLAWADRGLSSLDPRKIPPLARIWPYRRAAIVVLAAGSFTFLLIQVTNGFGMQRAIRKMVSEQFAKERAEAGVSQSKLAEVEYREEQEFNRFNLERTMWLKLALVCNFLATLAALAHIGLDRRGDRPPPRFVIQY